ncbi:MAG TPA: AAA family ATPase [Acidimicrobiales bacterium]|nr:AAA family ATPase [Acidimicrobiales bacterium]
MPTAASSPRRSDAPLDPPDPDPVEAEQGYLDRAYLLLAQMERRAAAAERDAAERAPGDWDATVAQRRLLERLASLREDGSPLCFGRIDEERGTAWHIGRRHVEDESGDPFVVDWRASVAVPFYRATFAHPLDLRRRRRFLLDGRRLEEVLEEDFADPDTVGRTSAAGLPDPLLATLGRARSGEMHDIVATIAADQDRIIRAPTDRTVVVQGGPGTGKTAVGLHRAAFLLYEHRQRLEREGVLVLGPNRLFLAYIAQVLPSLGEVAVTQTTLPGLVTAWPVRAEESAPAARLKGDPRMAAVLAAEADAALRPAPGDVHVATRWGSVRLGAKTLDELLDAARVSGGTARDRRSRFRRALSATVAHQLSDRRGSAADESVVAQDLAADRRLQVVLERMWPAQSAPALLRRFYSRARTGAARAGGLDSTEVGLLARAPRRSVRDEPWTEADLALLDEAQSLLAAPPRRYGHVVVDEAQDLSPMALRMVGRRSLDGRSLTVLGDLGQATAPGAPGDWGATLAALGDPPGAAVEELHLGYRVPAAIMDLANHFLAEAAPHLRPTRSVRTTDDAPDIRAVAGGALVDELVASARLLSAAHHTVAAIGVAAQLEELAPQLRERGLATDPPGRPPRAGFLALVRPEEAKGLEFDAVIIVEPGALVALPGGTGLLYIALTRAVQRLTVLHERALPPGLGLPRG